MRSHFPVKDSAAVQRLAVTQRVWDITLQDQAKGLEALGLAGQREREFEAGYSRRLLDK